MNNSISIQQRDSHSTHDAQEDIRNRDIAIYVNGDMVHRDEAGGVHLDRRRRRGIAGQVGAFVAFALDERVGDVAVGMDAGDDHLAMLVLERGGFERRLRTVLPQFPVGIIP